MKKKVSTAKNRPDVVDHGSVWTGCTPFMGARKAARKEKQDGSNGRSNGKNKEAPDWADVAKQCLAAS